MFLFDCNRWNLFDMTIVTISMLSFIIIMSSGGVFSVVVVMAAFAVVVDWGGC